MSHNYFSSPGNTGSCLAEPQREPQDDILEAAPPDTTGERHEDASILLGESVAASRLRAQVQRAAPYLRTALIRGEPGTGKQMVARAIHAISPGADRPFIVGNASAIASSIAGGDLSPPLRTATASSLLESANGGTLYIDGMGELPASLQAALLRFVRVCEERRSIANRADIRRSDTRILAASDRDLRTLASIGQFREDLYARLSVIEFLVPPLRQRVEDIPVLAAWLLQRLAQRTSYSGDPSPMAKMLARATLAQLQEREWPKNLDDLERVLANAAALADGSIIEPRHLLALVEPQRHSPASSAPVRVELLDAVIKQHVIEVLTRCGGNKLRAAELLGISRSTLYRMLESGPAASNLDAD